MRSDPAEISKKVQEIVDLLYAETAKAATGTVDADAERFWRTHYSGLFYRAIDLKNRDFSKDRKMLFKKADELGKEARRRAGTGNIKAEHAAVASAEVDCQRAQWEEWCN